MRVSDGSLSWQLLKEVLSIYFAITLLVTLTQMGIEYLHTRNTIQGELASVERTFSPALATALWEINTEQLEALQQGIVNLPVISSMRVIDASGRELIKESAHSVLGGQIIHTFKLSYRFSGEDVYLANVSFAAAGDVIFNRLLVGYQMILVSALVKSTALTLLFLWTFRRRLAIPLQQLTDAATAIDLDTLASKKHHLDLQQMRENELTQLEGAFNRMLKRLEEERVTHYSALEAMNKGLEAQVVERTAALEAANLRLAALSATDGLTGIANRRRFDEVAAVEWARSARSGNPLALLLLDVDHFKAYNDNYGHQCGDETLKQVARVLRENTRRPGDFAARYGGEEFVVIAADTGADAALTMAENIRAAVEALGLVHQHSSFGAVTVSIGVVVTTSGTAPHLESLIRMADTALYSAKSLGRNRVEMAG